MDRVTGTNRHLHADRFMDPRTPECTGSKEKLFFFALCCLGKIPGGAPFSQLLKSGNGSRVDRP